MSDQDPFALLKSMGFKDIPGLDELAKVDEATGAKLLSQAMNATNVRKLQTAEAKRDSRESVTSNAGIFGSFLTQAVGRNDASRAMKTLESDAKAGAAAQKAIAAFDRDLAMDDRSNELAGRNKDMFDDDLNHQRAVDLQREKEAGANRRHSETIAAKQAGDSAVDYKEVRNLQKALTGVESSFASNNEIAAFRDEFPGVKLNSASIANLNVHLTQASEFNGRLDAERGTQEGSTSTERGAGHRAEQLTAEDQKIEEYRAKGARGELSRHEQAVLEGMISQQTARRSENSGAALDARNNGAEPTLNENYDSTREHTDTEVRVGGEYQNQSTSQITADINDRDIDESKRDTLLEKKLWMLTKNAINDVTLKLGGTTVTDTMREDLQQLYGLNPHATQASQVAALNIQQKKLYQEARAISGGYSPRVRATYSGVDGYSSSILNSLDDRDKPLMEQPGAAGLTPEQEAGAAQNPGINTVLGSVGGGVNAPSAQRAFTHTGMPGGRGAQMADVSGATAAVDTASDVTARAAGLLPDWAFPKTQEKLKNVAEERKGQNPKQPVADPRNRQSSNLPNAMDIFKKPQNEGQANALAQTIAIIQSQSQLNA
jgi:hypothetical protein